MLYILKLIAPHLIIKIYIEILIADYLFNLKNCVF